MQKTFILIVSLFLSACSSLYNDSQPQGVKNNEAKEIRAEKLLELTRWKINGKIAVISPNERNSFSLSWYNDSLLNTQQLDLSTYLGINLLHLRSSKNEHHVEFDGKTYRSNDLDELLFQLTGHLFPTHALTYWLKGQTFSPSESIRYDQHTQLPAGLLSQYNDKNWQISYANYQEFQQYLLPTKLTIKQADITIKIAINEWIIK